MTDVLIESPERKWYTMLPNMVDDLGLDPYSFRLYVHFRRVAGEEGACWQSTRTLADSCKMSAGAVSGAKQVLVQNGLIVIETRADKKKKYHHVTIVNIWRENIEKYSCSPDEQHSSRDEQHSSPGETKKNPVKKNHVKNDSADAANLNKDPAPLPPGVPQMVAVFEAWLQEVNEGTNPIGSLASMCESLFPGREIPSYGKIGAISRQVGGPGRLASLLWQTAAMRPSGCPVQYAAGLAKNGSREVRKEESAPIAVASGMGERLYLEENL